MNEIDELKGRIFKQGFAYLNLVNQDKWESWTPAYSFVTATSLTVVGRYKVVGRQCFFQVKSSGTSIETTAGASYITLPLTAIGYGGQGQMDNVTTNIIVGSGVISVANNRFYTPSQGASGNTFTFCGWFEV